MIEAALAHVVRNRAEAAYARSDLFERRRVLMDDWALYLAYGVRLPAPSPARRPRLGRARLSNTTRVQFFSISTFPQGSL